jgi:K+:H+ antiporter
MIVSNLDLVLRLSLQLVVILAACHLVGMIGRRFGQSQAVCEMITGVLLGPSLLGWAVPEVQHWLFPRVASVSVGSTTATITHPSMIVLYAFSQIGLTIYMFLVGLEFDTQLFREQARRAGLISLAGVVVPFVLGAVTAPLLFHQSGLFGAGVTLWMATLFFGAALCITAFPILARILQEREIAGTRLGTLLLAAASIDDAVVWCLLAVVLASFKSSAWIALVAIVGGTLYVVGMLTLGGSILRFFVRYTEQTARRSEYDGGMTKRTLAVVLLILMLCAWFTTRIGLYEVFGAFIAGVVVQQSGLAVKIRQQLEPLTVSLLLPVFFVYSGLNTQLGLINTPTLWLVMGLIILVAFVGKGGACLLSARIAGESWRQSLAIGTLMNARGLIELILLNIGLEQGIITPTLFTILVFMAIITTLIASPLFGWLYGTTNHAIALPLEQRAD